MCKELLVPILLNLQNFTFSLVLSQMVFTGWKKNRATRCHCVLSKWNKVTLGENSSAFVSQCPGVACPQLSELLTGLVHDAGLEILATVNFCQNRPFWFSSSLVNHSIFCVFLRILALSILCRDLASAQAANSDN